MTKRLLVVAGFCLLLLLFSNAMAWGKIRAGVEGGFNHSSLSYDTEMDFWDTNSRSTFSLGAFVDIPVGEQVSFVPGMRYVRYGNSVDLDTGEHLFVRVTGDFEITQNYLAVPALFKVHPLKSEPVFVTFGPEVGILINATRKGTQRDNYTVKDSVVVSTFDDDICGNMEVLNLSLDVGAGIDFPMGGHTGSVQVRYALGIVGTAREKEWFSDWKTRGLEILAGFAW
jgi:hypothetical protein